MPTKICADGEDFVLEHNAAVWSAVHDEGISMQHMRNMIQEQNLLYMVAAVGYEPTPLKWLYIWWQ